MKPQEFEQQTNIGVGENMGDLPYFFNGDVLLTKWMPSKEELERMNNGEPIWLFQYYNPSQVGGIIPLQIEAKNPFIEG